MSNVIKKFIKLSTISFCGTLFAVTSFAVELQEAGKSSDWTIYKKSDGSVCAVSTSPQSSKAFRGDKEVSVDRGTIELMVTLMNGGKEPSFKSGYPLDTSRQVVMKIGNKEYYYFSDPNSNTQYAWPSPAEDINIIEAMKAGAKVQADGYSQRGTHTVDVFSLKGFTAAYQKAKELCGV